MPDQRSPFGELLRYHRRRLGMSQERLADHIVELGEAHPDIAALGVLSEKAIANLEMRRHEPATFVRPRPATVRLLSVIFALEPGTPEYTTFWRASGVGEPEESEAESESAPPTVPGAHGEPLPWELPGFVTNGRELQLARLIAAVDDALTGQPRVCFLSGEPGIGKTSLIAEAARRAVAAHGQLVVVWCECTGKFGAADAFQPVRQALHIMIGDTRAASPPQLISIANQDRLRQRAAVAIQALAALGDGLVERFISAESVIAQGDALGVRPGSWQTRLRQLAHRPQSTQSTESDEQFVRLLQRYAEEGPLLLVVEDLHWANHDLARVLFHLLRRLRGQTAFPILVIGSYRPTELDQGRDSGRHSMAALIDEAHQMFEDPVVDLASTIGSAPGRAFVNGIVDREANAVGQEFRDLIFARTAGHPYFTVELIRWFRAHGVLTRDAIGTWQTGTIPAGRSIPEGINAVIRERLGPLPAALHGLFRLASVQGEVFTLEVLAEVMGRDPGELGDLLDSELIRRYQLASDGGVVTIAGQRLHQYRFSHSLFQEFVYASLTALEREQFHAQTGTAMLKLFGGGTHEAAADIAVQFDRAGRPREAAAAYKEAGDHSTQLLEFQTASRFYRRAVDLAERESQIGLAALCYIGLANCAREMGDPAAAGKQADKAVALARAEKLSHVEVYGLFVQGLLDYDGGRYARAATRLAAAIPLLEQHGDNDVAGRARTIFSHVLYGQGAYDEALRQAQESALVADRLHNDWLAIDAEVAAANCQTDLGLVSVQA